MKKSSKLLVDAVSYFNISPDFAKKSVDANGNIILTGIFQRADVPNQNNRIYRKELLEREVNKLLPLIKDNQLVGECDHPEQAIISFSNTSHKILDLWWNGNDVMGKVQIIKGHPSGDKIIALLENGVKVGISSRALGDVEPSSKYPEFAMYQDVDVVCENLNLLTFDLVNNPSTYGSFLVTESLITEWNVNHLNKAYTNNNHISSSYDKKILYFIHKYGSPI